ncbi:MAG: hypothetical protein Fur0037_01540 [Planctomycetota bacterium]
MPPLLLSLFLASALSLLQGKERQEREPEGRNLQGQEAREGPAPPPEGSAPLPPVQEPFVAAIPRDDILLRFYRPDPIEGFYRLARRVVGGVVQIRPGDGFLAVGRRHMMLQVSAPTGAPDLPLLRAGTWRWRRAGDQIVLSVLLDHFNDADGELHLRAPGIIERRRIELLGDVLRVHQDDHSFLEFRRAE